MDESKKYKLPRHQKAKLFDVPLEKSEIFKEKDPRSCRIDKKPDNINTIKLGQY